MNDILLTEAVSKFRKTVFRAAYGCAGNFEDAEDITQETFMKLYLSAKKFNGDEHMKAFLIRTAINAAKSVRRTAFMSKRSDLSDDAPYYDDVADRELFDCVTRLPPKYRAVVCLYYYEDYSVADAAKILGIGQSAFTTRLSRAREQLKTTLGEGGIIYERKCQEGV